MKGKLNRSVALGGAALILFSGCVSSRKYKTSQAELAKARADSAQLAQQVATENGNIHDLQDKNSALQRSLDSTSTNYTAQQKTVDYYRNYFKDQQDTLAQVNQDVQSAITQAGVTNGDVQQADNAIYVRLDENDLFKKNSTTITPVGQKVLDNLAQLVRNRDNVHVAVASGDSAVAWVATDNMSAGSSMNPAPVHHRIHHVNHTSAPAATSSNATGAAPASPATATAGTQTTTAPAHKKVHHHYSGEGSTAMYTNGHPGNHNWALKQGRMVKVADRFLQNGVPKINLSLQRPPMNGTPQNTAIKIIITPKMKGLNPQNASAMAGTN
jgi:outer membrane protein OmpA-like peptidoglycan-associated protein